MRTLNIGESLKSPQVVTSAEAGVQNTSNFLDSRLRGNGTKRVFLVFYELIDIGVGNL